MEEEQALVCRYFGELTADDVRGLPTEDRAMLAEMAASELNLRPVGASNGATVSVSFRAECLRRETNHQQRKKE